MKTNIAFTIITKIKFALYNNFQKMDWKDTKTKTKDHTPKSIKPSTTVDIVNEIRNIDSHFKLKRMIREVSIGAFLSSYNKELIIQNS